MVTPSSPGDHYRHSSCPGREPAAGPHHTARAPVVCPVPAPLCCSTVVVSGGHRIDVFVWYMALFFSVFILFVFLFILFLADLRVCPSASLKKVVAVLSFMRKVKRKSGEAESGIIDSMCGPLQRTHTQSI